MKLSDAVDSLRRFSGAHLTTTLSGLETSLRGGDRAACLELVAAVEAHGDVLAAAGSIKQVAAQINVVIHALGILLCLPRVLEDGEQIEYVSLGAGNTGRPFDLETDRRIAEFKFIRWQGGPEAIRQNSVFKDFYLMAESGSEKRKYLYVLETEHPLKFFNGGRALASVLSRNVKLREDLRERFGDRFRTVREYYATRRGAIILQDVSPWVPGLAEISVDAED
jgi:hypothetical protein